MNLNIMEFFDAETLRKLHQNYENNSALGEQALYDLMPIVHLSIKAKVKEGDDCNVIATAMSCNNALLYCLNDISTLKCSGIEIHHILQNYDCVITPLYGDNIPSLSQLQVIALESAITLNKSYFANLNNEEEVDPFELKLGDFLKDFGDGLLAKVEEITPPLFNGELNPKIDTVIDKLTRKPFDLQRDKIHTVLKGLYEENLPAVVLNGEMGTGKTMMGICCAAVSHALYSKKPSLVLAPPHLVYKWRREILQTIPDAVVDVINGSDAINRLIRIVAQVNSGTYDLTKPRFIIIGRVRMRMGFNSKPAFIMRKVLHKELCFDETTATSSIKSVLVESACCPSCMKAITYKATNDGLMVSLNKADALVKLADNRLTCQHCHSPLWTMIHKSDEKLGVNAKLLKLITQLPTIGAKTAQKLLDQFGAELLTKIIDDNIYDFVNLMDSSGNFVFNDKQEARISKSLGKLEFALRFISYQPSEFIKRYFPRKFFGLAIVDEAHEYKNSGSAQGQAMGVLCSKAEKVLPLTGTLMGGYASDLFHLLFRIMPSKMVAAGYTANAENSLASAEMKFMTEHGNLIQVHKVNHGGSFKTAKAEKTNVSVKKAPGFGPMGVAQFILPYTAFCRLSDLGDNILPEYKEITHVIPMTEKMKISYLKMRFELENELRKALGKGDRTLLGTVLNTLLRWPDTCSSEETIVNCRTKKSLFYTPSHFGDTEISPKEQDVVNYCLKQQANNRKTLVFTVYTGEHDTAKRTKYFLEQAGLDVAILRASVKSDEREDWFENQLERGVDVVICNPELVKTGLDLLDFPSIYFMQTGFNVYTIEQASRRSWRIGQTEPVEVVFAGYAETAQMRCLKLMAAKIKVSQSTSGVMPETGLDIFNEESESSFTASLAKELLTV